MAESKRVYEIRINGIQESYEGVKSLREALSGLTDTVINVSNEEKKTSETRKSTASSTDALAKAQEKLNSYDRAYQEELAKVNAELSANKKEINDALKLQQAQDVVDAKQLDTYAQKQQYLSALNTLIRNHSTATEEDTQAIDRMVQESAALQAELKATDAQMQIYVRNVGNYQGAADTMIESHKGIKQELKDIKTEMAEMLANGVSKTDEGYLKLAERAGQLKDALGDANQDIANFASDTQGLSNAINLASSAVNAYQLYNSTMELFGAGNEEAAESMKKMMAVMTVLNSLQQVQNSLLENGSATARLYNKAVELIQAALGLKKTAVEADTAATEANAAANEANVVSQEANAAANEASAVAEGVETAAKEANTVATGTNSGALGTNTGALGANAAANQAAATATNTMSVAQKAGAVASKTLSVALRAIPLMAIIGLVMALIQNWQSIWNWFKKTFPVLDTLSKKFNKFGGLMNAIITGAKAVAAAVANWLINPFKTFANVVGKILSGDFEGAWKAAVDGVKNQFKGTVDAFKGEIVKGFAEGEKEMTATAAKESNKRTKQELEELKIQERNNKTYSKKYIDLQKKDFEERKKMAKGNQEELNKIKLEEMKFDADVEDKKTAYAKSQANERAKNAKAAAAAAKKDADAAKKDYEKWQKELSDLIKKNQKDVEDADKTYTTARKNYLKTEDELQKKLITSVSEHYDKNVKNAILIEDTIKLYEEERKRLVSLRKEARKLYEEDPSEENLKVLEEYRKQVSETDEKLNRLLELKRLTDDQFTAEQIAYQKLYSARVEIATTSFLEEQAVQREGYKKQINELEDNLSKLRDDLSKARTEAQKKEIQDEIDDAEASIKTIRNIIKTEFGKIGEFGDIKIPVDIDVENVNARFTELMEAFADKGKEMPISFLELTQSMLGITQKLSDDVRTIDKVWDDALKGGKDKLMDLAETIGYVLNVSEDEMENLKEMVKKAEPFEKIEIDLMEILTLGNTKLDDLGSVALGMLTQIQNLFKEYKETALKAYNDTISKQDKVISGNEKLVKSFQDAAKGIKFEPVMQDDFMSGLLKGQIIDLDKTRDRYDNLKKSYEEYLETVKPGSESMQKIEEAWQIKLLATKKQYGENSNEYRTMVNEKEKSDAAYAMEYEKVTKQIEDISKKQADLMYDYIKSITDRIADITKTIQDNVMNPIFDGLSDLFAFQLEEAEDALDEITELYDKAVEAREQSADRMKEINEELRADDGQNKEELQQRLAEEEVLLVQREEAERALQKEKEKREKEVEKKEAQQRVLELSQKLVEGIANTALGATAALKYGFPLGPVFAAIIAAMGAVQTAIISKQIAKAKSKMAAGGKVGEDGVSRSHKQGGHRIEGTNIEVEGHEWVINKKSSDKYDGLLRAINDDNAGMIRRQIEIIRERRIVHTSPINKFADGGRINTLAATNAVRENNEIAALTELVKQIDFEPVVSVVDINKTQKRLVRVKEFAGSVS